MLYDSQQEYNQALSFYKKSLNKFIEYEDSLSIAEVYNNIASTYLKQSNWQLSLEYYTQALSIAKIINNEQLLSTIYLNLSKFYEKKKEYFKAYDYQSLYLQNEAELKKGDREITAQLATIGRAYEVIIKDKELDLEKTKNQKLINILLSGLAIVTIIILISLFWGIRQRLKNMQAHQKIDKLLREQELRTLSDQLEGEARERKRIAADLHDRVGSLLSTLKLYFNDIFKGALEKTDNEKITKTNELLNNTVDEVRRISHDMAAGILEKIGLVNSIKQLAHTINEINQIKVNVISMGMGMEMGLDEKIERKIYRIVHELTSNALKYSKGTELNIQLIKDENALLIDVEDNGIGFDINNSSTFGMGLKNVKALVHSLEGTLEIDSNSKNGTSINIEIQVEKLIKMINVLIADDHKVFLEGLTLILEQDDKIKIVGTAINGEEAIPILEKENVHVAVLDIRMPKMNGLELTKYIKERLPQIKVLILTMFNEKELIISLMNARADGYILKNSGQSELLDAIKQIYHGGNYYPTEIMKTILEYRTQTTNEISIPLTSKETEVLQLIAKEHTTSEIAEKLFISTNTVNSHRRRLLSKTKTRNAAGLTLYALRHGLILNN